MKELVLKKRSELKELCRKTHLVPDSKFEDVTEAIESGVVDAATILEQIELHIAKVKEEAFSRKEILEKVDKWLAACEEECWLDEYNRDENRYNLGKGTHLALKRAEKARALVSKLPGRTEALTSKTLAWEQERGTEFLYDGVPLLSMLEDYAALREEKEQERRRLRDQKKLQGQIIAEQEVLYGSKLCPSKPQSAKKCSKQSSGVTSTRRAALGGSMLKPDSVNSPRTPQTRYSKKTEVMFQNDRLNHRQNDGIPASPAFLISTASYAKMYESLTLSLSAVKRGLETADTPFQRQAMHSMARVPMQTDRRQAPTTRTSDNNNTKPVEGSHEEIEGGLKKKDWLVCAQINK
ncbi:hypothetical protein GQ457_12G007310 [Hibiscus cannabinus]